MRSGFIIFKRDIEGELAVIRRVKLGKEMSLQEKLAEEQLLKDLELIERTISQEVWDIEKTM